jgi:hypothetical protein
MKWNVKNLMPPWAIAPLNISLILYIIYELNTYIDNYIPGHTYGEGFRCSTLSPDILINLEKSIDFYTI